MYNVKAASKIAKEEKLKNYTIIGQRFTPFSFQHKRGL